MDQRILEEVPVRADRSGGIYRRIPFGMADRELEPGRRGGKAL